MQLLCKNICTVSTQKASHRYESACEFSGCRPERLSSCIGCSCVSFSNEIHPWCWNLLSCQQLALSCLSCVLTLSQQGLITTEKIYMVMRARFKKSESEGPKTVFYRPSTNCYEGIYGLQHQLGYLATHYRTGSSSKSIIKGNVASRRQVHSISNWILPLRPQHLVYLIQISSPSSPGVFTGLDVRLQGWHCVQPQTGKVIVICPSRWSLYLSLALCLDHLDHQGWHCVQPQTGINVIIFCHTL